MREEEVRLDLQSFHRGWVVKSVGLWWCRQNGVGGKVGTNTVHNNYVDEDAAALLNSLVGCRPPAASASPSASAAVAAHAAGSHLAAAAVSAVPTPAAVSAAAIGSVSPRSGIVASPSAAVSPGVVPAAATAPSTAATTAPSAAAAAHSAAAAAPAAHAAAHAVALDGDLLDVHVHPVEVDGSLLEQGVCGLFLVEGDEAEVLGLVVLAPVYRPLDLDHVSELGEVRSDLVLGHGAGELAHIDLALFMRYKHKLATIIHHRQMKSPSRRLPACWRPS